MTDRPADRLVAELHPDAIPHLGGLRARFGENAIGRIDLRIVAEDRIWVSHLVIEEAAGRGRGHGARQMERLTESADRHGVGLSLEAFWRPDLDDGGWLARFYRRFGFEPLGGPDDQGMQEFLRAPGPADPFPAAPECPIPPSPGVLQA